MKGRTKFIGNFAREIHRKLIEEKFVVDSLFKDRRWCGYYRNGNNNISVFNQVDGRLEEMVVDSVEMANVFIGLKD